MKNIRSYCKSNALLAITASVAIPTLMTSCGSSGGGGDEDSNIRPQTLDELVLTLDDDGAQTVQLEFLRAIGSPDAVSVGNPESGAVIYSIVDGGLQFSESVTGIGLDYHWPRVASINYTYAPINNSSGVLTLTTADTSFFTADSIADDGTVIGGSETRVGQNIVSGTGNVQLINEAYTSTFNLTFNASGDTITNVTATIAAGAAPAGSAGVSIADSTLLTEATIATESGGSVPVNYSLDNDDISDISNVSLDEQTVIFTPDGAASPIFSSQCTATGGSGVGPGIVGQQNVASEEGTCIYFDANGNAITGAADYTYEQIEATDDAVFVLADVPGATILFGEYTLSFITVGSDTQVSAGTYVVSAPGQANDGQTGTFSITNASIVIPTPQ